jgi:hypothetical protein
MTPLPPYVLGVLLALAACTLATAIGWTIAIAASRLSGRARSLEPRLRAQILAGARLMPLFCSGLLVPVQMLAFGRFEADGRTEGAGPLLWLLAAAGVLLAVDAARSAAASWRRTRGIAAMWQASATPLALPRWQRPAWRIRRAFPVVAVVGCVRPQLYVAAQVAEACSADELAAIAVHEDAHVRARDNVLRLLFALTPGSRFARGPATRLEDEWNLAAEEAADAAARNETSALDLASALTKVARMAADAPPEVVPASALIGGLALDVRVRRLLEPASASRRLPVVGIVSLATAALVTVVVSTPVLAVVHDLFETLVKR